MSAGEVRAVTIGASAGAVQTLLSLLPDLPASFPAPVLVVVHVPADRPNALIELFSGKCRMAVKEAEDTEPAQPGTIYFAPPDYHLLAERDGTLSLAMDEPVHFSRPSIDVLFESAADAYGSGAIGIVLTGANEDGAAGLRAIADAGGTAIVENPEEAAMAAMPQAALAACPQASVRDLAGIAEYLQGLAQR